MKKQFFSFLVFITLAFQISAQTVDQSETEKNLRRHVSYLASDELEGRRTGETGATSAAGYVMNMFTNYRLGAGVVNGSQKGYLQAFPYVSGVGLGEENSFDITDTKNLTSATVKSDWAPLSFSPNSELAYTPVVYAGFGISSANQKYDDYAGLDVKDKIVVVFDGVPDNDNPHNLFFPFNAHAKAKIAKEKGAKALILISRSKRFGEDKLPNRFDQTLGETAIPTIVVSRQLAAGFLNTDDAGLLSEEEKLNAFANGKLDRPKGFFAKDQTLLARLKIDLTKKKVAAYNVIGVLAGTDPVLRNEVIVIGAHYDHLGHGGAGSLDVNSKAIHHGADDNASGTSAVLELARQFSESRSNKRTIIFMAFGGEEEGLLGSNYWVNNPTVPLAKVVAMINMDMVGRLKDKKLTIGGIGTASEFNQLVTKNQPYILGNGIVGEKAETAVKTEGDASISVSTNGKIVAAKDADKNVFDLQLNQDGFGPSDHSSFYGKKIPVLFFFTGTHVDYHKLSDTSEKINYKGLEQVVNFVSNITRAIDQNQKRPTYTVAPSSGMQGGRTGFSVSLGTVPSYADGNNDGLVLDGVREDSPASKAGIKAGDKIVRLGGKEIRNISDYVFVLGEMKADQEYEIVVMRGAKKLSLKIIPSARK